MVSDPDAGWCVKTNTEGNKKFVWGYKAHILADTQYELPLVVDVTAGNVSDFKRRHLSYNKLGSPTAVSTPNT